VSTELQDFTNKLIDAFIEASKESERSRLADALLDIHHQNGLTSEQLELITRQVIEGENLTTCPEAVLHLLGSIIAYLEYVPQTKKPIELFLGDCTKLNAFQLEGAITIIEMSRDARFTKCLQSMYLTAGFEDRKSIQLLLSELSQNRNSSELEKPNHCD
jgi:hypothetical protein